MIRPFSVDKMRRNLARNVPDVVWRDFDPLEDFVEVDVNAWRGWFCRMMTLKHGTKLKNVIAYHSDTSFEIFPKVRVQLHAELWR